MSQVSSGKGKENAPKTKFASLNVNQTFRGTKLEARTTTGPTRHGMCSLGKVGQSRRLPAPANLPSIKKENKGNDPSVNIVPSTSGWGSKKEHKEQTNKQEDQGPTATQKQAKVGQAQEISLRPNAGVAVKQGDGTKTWSNLQTSTGSTSQPTTTYFQKEFPKLGGEGEASQGTNEKELQEEKDGQQTRQMPPKFQSDQKFMDGHGAPILPPGPMVGFQPDQRQMFNGGPAYFGRQPYIEPPYGHGPMPPALFQHNYMMQMGARYPFPPGRPEQFPPFDPNFGRGMPPTGQRMPMMPQKTQKPPVAQSERPSIVRDEDLKNLVDDDDEDGDGWAGAQEEVDYNVKLKFDDSDVEENDVSTVNQKQDTKLLDSQNSKLDVASHLKTENEKENGHEEEKVKGEKPLQKDDDGHTQPPVSQSWTEMTQGYPGQVQMPFNPPPWQGAYPPPTFDHSRGPPPNYPPYWFSYPVGHSHPGYGVPMAQGQQQKQQGQSQPQQMQMQPPQVTPKAQSQSAGSPHDGTEEKDLSATRQQLSKPQKPKTSESAAIQEKRRKKQEEEHRLAAERKAAAQAKLTALEEKIKKKEQENAQEKKAQEVDSNERLLPPGKEREDLDSKGQRDRRDSEASDTSRTSSQPRSERSYPKCHKEVPPRFRKQHQQHTQRTSSEENANTGTESDYLNLPSLEGRLSPMSQSSDLPVRKIMKRHDSSRSDDACSVTSQDSMGINQGMSGSVKEELEEPENTVGLRRENQSSKAHAVEDEINLLSREKEQLLEDSRSSEPIIDNDYGNLVDDELSYDATQTKRAWEDKKQKRNYDSADDKRLESSASLDKKGVESAQFDAKIKKSGFDEKEQSKETDLTGSRKNREQKPGRSYEETESGRNEKLDRIGDKKNFRRLEKSTLSSKSSKPTTNKERTKSEKDLVKQSNQVTETKHPSAWAKVVAGEKESGRPDNLEDEKLGKQSQKTLSDIQKEEEEKVRRETENQRKHEETRKDLRDSERSERHRRDDYKSSRADRSGYLERRESERSERRKKFDRGDNRSYKEDRRGYQSQYGRNDYGSQGRRGYRGGDREKPQSFKEIESDDNEEQPGDSRNDDTYESKYDRQRQSKTHERNRSERDYDRERDRAKNRSVKDEEYRPSRTENGSSKRDSHDSRDYDKKHRERRQKEYGYDRQKDDTQYESSLRRERKQGYDNLSKRQAEERKRKHDGGRAEYRGYKEEVEKKENLQGQGRDESRKGEGKTVAYQEGSDSKQFADSQARTSASRNRSSREGSGYRKDGYGDRKGGFQKKRPSDGDTLSISIDNSDSRTVTRERKEPVKHKKDGSVEGIEDEEEGENDVIENEDGEYSNYSDEASEVEEISRDRTKTRRGKDREQEAKKAAHESRGSRERKTISRGVSRPYYAGRGSQRPYHRTSSRSSYKENMSTRRYTRSDQRLNEYDGEQVASEEEYISDEGGGDEGEQGEQSSSKYRESSKGTFKSSSSRSDVYHRTSRYPRGGQERRWGKDQPPRFKKQSMQNKPSGRGRDRDYSRSASRGRGYTSYNSNGRDKSRKQQGQSGPQYLSRQQQDDLDNESGGSGVYHTAEENAATTSSQESSHRKVTSSTSRGRGYSRGHGSRGGNGPPFTNSQEGKSFLADRQQARVGQVGTSAQACTLPAALDGPALLCKDSEVRSSALKAPISSKHFVKNDKGAQNTQSGAGSFHSCTESFSDMTDEPPKKIPKNKASIEAKRDILKEYDLSNIASVVVIDDFCPSTEPAAGTANDDDGFVQVTSRKAQKELREKQREEVRKKQREESSHGAKASKSEKDSFSLKTGKSQKTSEQYSGRFVTPLSQGQSTVSQVPVTTSQASNAAMAAVGGWEPAQSLMRTSQIVANGNAIDGSKSVTVPAPPPPVNAWQRPLTFASTVTSVTGTVNHSKTPDPKAVGTGKPSATNIKLAVSMAGSLNHVPVSPAVKQQNLVLSDPVTSQSAPILHHSLERKVEEIRDNSGSKKIDVKKEKIPASNLKGPNESSSTKKVYNRSHQVRDKVDRTTKDGKPFPNRQPVLRRDKLIDRKTKRERPPRFRNISKSRTAPEKGTAQCEDDTLEHENAHDSSLTEGVDKVVTGGSTLQGDDRAPGKRPQSYDDRNQLQSDTTSKSSGALTQTLQAATSASQVAEDTMSRVTRGMPVPIGVGSPEIRPASVERDEEQLASPVLCKAKDDCSSAEEEENAKDTARSVIKSLSDDDEKALETRSLPVTPPLAVEIPEPAVSGPSSDPGRTASPAAPNSMAQEMNEMSKKVLFTKKLWDDVSNPSVVPIVVPQSSTLTTWSDGTDSSQKVMKDITTAVTTKQTPVDSVGETQSDSSEDTSTTTVKPEEKPTPAVTSQSAFGKKTVIEQQNVCKVKPQQQQQQQQQQQSQPPEHMSSDPRATIAQAQSQSLTSPYLIPSHYPVPVQSGTSQAAKLHPGYYLPVENITPSLQQAFLTQGDSPRYQDLTQQQPISLNIHPVNQPAARTTSALPQQQQQQPQEIIRPLVVNNLYGPGVQGGQNQVLAWQVVTTHSVHTSSSVSFQSHLQGSHSGNVFSQNGSLQNTPLVMTFDPQSGPNSSIFSTQRVSSHLQQPPVGLVVQQPQTQTLPSYVGVLPGGHQSTHEHHFSVRTPPAKLPVGTNQITSAQLHHASSPLPLGSGTLSRHQALDIGEPSVQHLTSGSAHLPVGQRSTIQAVSGMGVLSPGMTVASASLHLPPGSSQSLGPPEGHMSSQSDLTKHVNAKPFHPSAKTPPSVGVSTHQQAVLSHAAIAHQRNTQNPLVAPVRPRPVQSRNLPQVQNTVGLQNGGRLAGNVSPVDQGVAYMQNTLQVKGHVSNLSQHALAGSSLQHAVHLPQAIQSQFTDHQGQVVGHSRTFNSHQTQNQAQRFARSAPGPIQRPSPVGVVSGIVPIRPKLIHHPQVAVSKIAAAHPQIVSQHQQNKTEQFQLASQQPQDMFRNQQHQKMIEETKKFFQKELVSHVVKGPRDGSNGDTQEQNDAKEDSGGANRGIGKHESGPEVVSEEHEHTLLPISSGHLNTMVSVKSSLPRNIVTTNNLPQHAVKTAGTNCSASDTGEKENEGSLVSNPQPQRQQERNRRAQRTGK